MYIRIIDLLSESNRCHGSGYKLPYNSILRIVPFIEFGRKNVYFWPYITISRISGFQWYRDSYMVLRKVGMGLNMEWSIRRVMWYDGI